MLALLGAKLGLPAPANGNESFSSLGGNSFVAMQTIGAVRTTKPLPPTTPSLLDYPSPSTAHPLTLTVSLATTLTLIVSSANTLTSHLSPLTPNRSPCRHLGQVRSLLGVAVPIFELLTKTFGDFADSVVAKSSGDRRHTSNEWVALVDESHTFGKVASLRAPTFVFFPQAGSSPKQYAAWLGNHPQLCTHFHAFTLRVSFSSH